jgi:kynureninase
VTELLAYRDRFPILRGTTYLINHSLGAMPAEAESRLREYTDAWKRRGIRAWGEGWWDLPLTTGDAVGRLIGAPRGTVCMHQNVTIATAVVVSCFQPEGERRRLLLVEEEFPSVRYLCSAQAERGFDVVVVPDATTLLETLDERTLVVPLSHVLFRNGEVQEVAPVVHRAHEVGARVLLDAYQSAGVVPLDVEALAVDFAVGGSLKWLCGGPGAAWLYVRADLAERLRPTLVGWQAHERPFAFEPELAYASGIARFLTGTPNVPALYAASAGRDIVEEVGVERIRESSLRQTRLLIDLLEQAGFDVTSPRDERRGGTVTVAVPACEAVHRELAERNVLCDFRPGSGIRLGPHYFTSDDELRFAVGQIVDIVEGGAYERYVGAAARY